VKSLIYIFAYVFVPVTVCTCARIGCAPQLCCRTLLRRRRPSFPAGLTCFHLFATVWLEVTWLPLCSNWGRDFSTLSSQTLLKKKIDSVVILERRRARSSCSVCCRWYDWRRPLSRSAVQFATLWHCRELFDERYAHHIQFEFWLLQRLTPAVTDRPPTVLRCQQSVPSVSSITQLLQRVCCSALAASC